MTKKKITVLYGNELEGRLSAYIVKHFYRNRLECDLELIEEKGNIPLHEIVNHIEEKQDELFLLDTMVNNFNLNFSIRKANKLIVIDNHQITNTELFRLERICRQYDKTIEAEIDYISFEHSAVYNTFKYFDKESEVPLFIEYFDIWNSDRFTNLNREESLESLYFVNGLSSLIIDDYTIELLLNNDKVLLTNIISIGKSIYDNLHSNTEFYEGRYGGLARLKAYDVLQYTYGLDVSDVENLYDLTCVYVYNGEKWLYNIHSKRDYLGTILHNPDLKTMSRESILLSSKYYKYNFLEELGKLDK